MTTSRQDESLKRDVKTHWSDETCGTRGLDPADRKAFFENLETERYRLEPHIPGFARWERGTKKRVLEIGVGAGTDHIQGARAGAKLTGIDLTPEAVALTKERLSMEGFEPDVHEADAENLPFPDDHFDIVYSHGVLHHSPDTERCIAHVHRVLKPGGTALIMVYNLRSWTAWNLWALHCLAKGRPWKSARWAVYNCLESPGTKAYTRREIYELMKDFRLESLESRFLGGDLLHMRASEKYQGAFHQMVFRLYPRPIVRALGPRFGLAWLIEATKH